MLLNLDHRKILLDVLATMFSQIDDFRTFLKNNVGKRLDEISTGHLATARSDVIDDAEEKEWLIALLEALHAEAGPGAKEKLNSIGTIEEIKEARFHDECYVDQYPLVNRKDLRARLRKFTKTTGPRILQINGTRYSGKSHTLMHIRHVARSLGISLAEIELRKWATGEEIRAYDIGITIADAVPLTLPPHLDAKASRWAINFLNWLVPQLDTKRRRLWIVFDDFEAEKLKYPLPESLYDFIHEIAEKTVKSQAVRLFLINYDRALPNLVKPTLETENVPTITEKDLGDFFLYFYNDFVSGVDLAAAEKDAVTRARRVFTRMNGDAAARLESMRDALTEECNELLKEGTP